MRGCTGGTFLWEEVPTLNEWVEFDGPYMVPDFDRAPTDPNRTLIPWNDDYNLYLGREELLKEEWWHWKEIIPPPNVSRPSWWNVTNREDAKVSTSRVSKCIILIIISLSQFYMPTVWASRPFIDGLTNTLGQAQLFCLNNRDAVERMYSNHPPLTDFLSFPPN